MYLPLSLLLQQKLLALFLWFYRCISPSLLLESFLKIHSWSLHSTLKISPHAFSRKSRFIVWLTKIFMIWFLLILQAHAVILFPMVTTTVPKEICKTLFLNTCFFLLPLFLSVWQCLCLPPPQTHVVPAPSTHITFHQASLYPSF